ncbi:MAG: hypothetical protein LRY71_12375 [Bacillaceae bacterium]|nr:hypothetical protein [Bacillaceae bacterium]
MLKIKKHGKAMAYTGACIGLSAIVGPAFGSMTAQFVGVQWVFLYREPFYFFTFGLLSFSLMKEKTRFIEKKYDEHERFFYVLFFKAVKQCVFKRFYLDFYFRYAHFPIATKSTNNWATTRIFWYAFKYIWIKCDLRIRITN